MRSHQKREAGAREKLRVLTEKTLGGHPWKTIQKLFEELITIKAVANRLQLPYKTVREFVFHSKKRHDWWESNWARHFQEIKRTRWREAHRRNYLRSTAQELKIMRQESAFIARTVRLERLRLEREERVELVRSLSREAGETLDDLTASERASD